MLFQNTLTVTELYQLNLEKVSPDIWSGINSLSYSYCGANTLPCGETSRNSLNTVPVLENSVMSRRRKDNSSNLLLCNNLLWNSVAEISSHCTAHHSVGQEFEQDLQEIAWPLLCTVLAGGTWLRLKNPRWNTHILRVLMLEVVLQMTFVCTR